MAAARSHVDSSINERRLRPIYDCLDNGNNKKAIQEAEKVLKKQRDFQCAKVLKSLALLRLGKQDDSGKLLHEVHSEVPTDDATLQAMTICYRELHRLDLIAEAYEAATHKEPQNEELLSHLFMAYVRLGEYKKQQQVAMALYKLKAKNPYYFWGVMSIVMQAHHTKDEIAHKMLLPLAERMTEKFVRENKVEAEAEVQLYLLILELEHKYETALEVLEGPLGEKLVSFLNFRDTKRAELLTKLQRWPEVNATYRSLIATNPDNWRFLCEYLDSLFRLVEAGYQPPENLSLTVDYTVSMAQEFLLQLIEVEKEKKSKELRGPFLAYIRLVGTARAQQHAEDLLVKLLEEYFCRFGDKACCFEDLFHLVVFMTEEEKLKFLSLIKLNFNLEPDTTGPKFAVDGKQMQRHISYSLFCHHLGANCRMSSADQLLLVEELILRYHAGSCFGAGLLSTDVRPNDCYCVLASHILIDVWRETGDISLLHQALLILEGGLKNSPSSHQIKLLLIKLYNCIGAVGATYSVFASMDIKHIQQDALGYLVTPHVAAKGQFGNACILYGNMLKFFTSNYKDIVDCLISSYKFGSFTKIQEFVDFRDRLNNSLQYAAVAMERMIQDLILITQNHQSTEQIILYMEIDPEKDKSNYEELRDSRDLDTMVYWDPPSRRVTTSTKQLSFAGEVEWLKLRNLVVRCLAAAYLVSSSDGQKGAQHIGNCCNGNHHAESSNPRSVLEDLLKQLREFLNDSKPDAYILPQEPIQGPSNTRLVAHLKGRFTFPVLELLSLVMHVHQLKEYGDAAASEKLDFLINTVIVKEVKECTGRVVSSLTTDNFQNLCLVPAILDDLVSAAEMLSFSAIIIGFCHQILKPIRGYNNRRGKKKQESTKGPMPQVIESYNRLVSELESSAKHLHDSIKRLQVESVAEQINRVSLTAPIVQNEFKQLAKEIAVKIDSSYQTSLSEVADLVYLKIKYLGLLHL